MKEVGCLLVVSFLRSLTPSKGDAEVSCVFTESCILPCSFKTGNDPVIYWTQVTGRQILVHSYHHNQDQHFKNRTSLFKEQISRGNASLQLTGVEVQDQGRYQCYTSTTSGNKDSYINLKVDAPVIEVDIQQVENRLTCSSEGIYPEPELTWSIDPPSNVTFKNTTTVQQTEQQLYNISSSLILSDSDTDLVFSCTVSTRRNWRRTTLRQLYSIRGSSADTTIPCRVSNTSLMSFSLVWRFNHSQIILNQTRTDVSYPVSERWRQKVKGVSKSGSLLLQDLSLEQEGIYTCELRTDEETYITNTFLRMEKGSETNNVTVMTVAVLVGVTLLVLLTGLWTYKYKKKKEETIYKRQSQHVEEADL